MPTIFDYSGDDDFCPAWSLHSKPKEPSFFLSLARHVDVYFPPRKRSRISAPFVFSGEGFEQKQQPSIEILPDECMFEIFRRMPGGQEKSACACVSKRWLMLVSSIQRDELCSKVPTQTLNPEASLVSSKAEEPIEGGRKNEVIASNGIELKSDDGIESDGFLSRCLEGKKATDVRLAAIAVGTGSRGGLGKLSIRGNNSSRGVTDLGLRVIARGCPSLRVLSLWDVSSIGDEGLLEIANGCRLLEKLDLVQCPAISDKTLLAFAKNCPNLTSLTIESCLNVGSEGIEAVGKSCPNLKSVSIKDCPLVCDQGIAGLFSSASSTLSKVKLQALDITDVSLAVIGHYGKALTDLVLTGLQKVGERGFWVLGNARGLHKLKSLTVTSCRGMTDLGLDAVVKGCPSLKQFFLRKSSFLSDNGLVSFAKSAGALESLQLEECHRITQYGFFGTLFNCGAKLKALGLTNCLGIKDVNFGLPLVFPCISLQTLSIRNCPGFGNASLSLVGRLCPQLQNLDLTGQHGITDTGILPLLENVDGGLVKVNLGGCINVTDNVVSTIVKRNGLTLELLNLDGCKNITDASLVSIAENCSLLSELDLSNCASITDYGIAAMARANQLGIQILSLSGCWLLSNKSVPLLKKLGQTLLGLNLQNCYGICSNKVDVLVEQLWRCDILY